MGSEHFDDVTSEYDAQAEEYRASTQLPARVYGDHFMVYRVAGPLQGKRVLDLACGEGHYSRLLMAWGAAEVLGVDISGEMIKLAEAAEAADPRGCRYRVGDVASLDLGETYDLVVGNYLLNYAADGEQLRALCRAIARHLPPGGRFLGLNLNMTLAPSDYAASAQYGFGISAAPDRQEGDPIFLEISNADGSRVHLQNHYLSPASYQAAFVASGFEALAWQGPWVSEAGLAAFPEGYWDGFLSAPYALCLEARKAG